jgi:hypothetical protein
MATSPVKVFREGPDQRRPFAMAAFRLFFTAMLFFLDCDVGVVAVELVVLDAQPVELVGGPIGVFPAKDHDGQVAKNLCPDGRVTVLEISPNRNLLDSHFFTRSGSFSPPELDVHDVSLRVERGDDVVLQVVAYWLGWRALHSTVPR